MSKSYPDPDEEIVKILIGGLIFVLAIVLFLIAFIAIPSGVLLGRAIKRLLADSKTNQN